MLILLMILNNILVKLIKVNLSSPFFSFLFLSYLFSFPFHFPRLLNVVFLSFLFFTEKHTIDEEKGGYHPFFTVEKILITLQSFLTHVLFLSFSLFLSLFLLFSFFFFFFF